MVKSFPHLHIIGVDISEEMVQVANHNLSSLGFGEFLPQWRWYLVIALNRQGDKHRIKPECQQKV